MKMNIRWTCCCQKSKTKTTILKHIAPKFLLHAPFRILTSERKAQVPTNTDKTKWQFKQDHASKSSTNE